MPSHTQHMGCASAALQTSRAPNDLVLLPPAGAAYHYIYTRYLPHARFMDLNILEIGAPSAAVQQLCMHVLAAWDVLAAVQPLRGDAKLPN